MVVRSASASGEPGKASLVRRPVVRPDGQLLVPRHLPGEARMTLDEPELSRRIEQELLTPELDRLAPHLWLVATQDSGHVSSLHHQIVRGRRLVVTESARLHLVWAYDRVFVKPLPEYLLSQAFWAFYLGDEASPLGERRAAVRAAACGFVRSYGHLIRHRSDFELAQREAHRLLPARVSFEHFGRFIAAFEAMDDGEVSARYHFGDLRLTRLNHCSKVFLFRFSYHKLHSQYGAYFTRFYGPLLFVFAIFSLVLSAMQVELGVQALPDPAADAWAAFTQASRAFAVFTLCCVGLSIAFLLSLFLALVMRETVFALGDLARKRWRPGRRDETAKA